MLSFTVECLERLRSRHYPKRLDHFRHRQEARVFTEPSGRLDLFRLQATERSRAELQTDAEDLKRAHQQELAARAAAAAVTSVCVPSSVVPSLYSVIFSDGWHRIVDNAPQGPLLFLTVLPCCSRSARRLRRRKPPAARGRRSPSSRHGAGARRRSLRPRRPPCAAPTRGQLEHVYCRPGSFRTL